MNNAETSVLAFLEGPTDRYSQACCEFEQSIKVFSGKSKMDFRDWAKIQFMRDNINEFIDIIAVYKSTILVCLDSINMLVAARCLLLTLLTSCPKAQGS